MKSAIPATALHAMVEALWAHMEAIEHFITYDSIRDQQSVVFLTRCRGTAARLDNAVQQKKLIAIIQDD